MTHGDHTMTRAGVPHPRLFHIRFPFPLLLLAALLTACVHGVFPKKFPPAMGPEGATVNYSLRSSKLKWEGELFAVDSTGFLILNRLETRGTKLVFQDRRLVRVPWASIQDLDMDKLAYPYDVYRNEVPTADRLATLRLVARFPQGVSAERLAIILRTLGLERVEELK